jgi:methylglutamate dehydrogenase subunit C
MSTNQPMRLSQGGLVDRDRPVTVHFDGRPHVGYAGDTLASLLLANGVRMLGRSFKYHRPRGLFSAGLEEPNALVEVGDGAARTPNTRATLVEAVDGLQAWSQNRYPSLRFDLYAVNGWFHRMLVAGFYYKTFMWPSALWERLYERQIRRAAGLGRPPTGPDPSTYRHVHAHADVVVAGAGIAGLMAALAAARSGARVILVEARPWLGGRIGCERAPVAGLPGEEWLARCLRQFENLGQLRVLRRTTLVGVHDHDVLAAVEETDPEALRADPGLPRQRLWVIRPRRIIVASGAWERPMVFDDNDRPGVMLAGALRSYLNRFAVAPGRQVVVATAHDEGYRTAFDLQAAGVAVSAVLDARAQPGEASALAKEAGIRVMAGRLPARALGGRSLQGVRVQGLDGGAQETLECDTLAVSAGFSPDLSLLTQGGQRPRWDAGRGLFLPPEEAGTIRAAGAAAGCFGADAAMASGWAVGLRAAAELGFVLASDSLPADLTGPAETATASVAARSATLVGGQPGQALLDRCPGTGKAFVDLQHDVTAADVELAHREGFVSVEHLKRYTTLGMATDQGKTSNVNGLLLLAKARALPVDRVGTTRSRPPAVPVAVGVYAGHRRGRQVMPVRRTALHDWHERHGARFVEAGQWLRPSCYPQAGEDIAAATVREARAVRSAVGICDVSTLGKIDVMGPDAALFLDRLYLNGMRQLPVGRVRYGLMLRPDGHVFDDGTATRLSPTHFLVTTTTANAARVLTHMEFHAQVAWPELDVAACSATEQWATIAVAGPRSRDALAAAFPWMECSDAVLPFMGYLETRAPGLPPLRLFRISFSGELAYEVSAPWGWGEWLWQRLLAAGARHGITPYGTEALGVLRIEKGHPAGAELDGRTTAVDLGLGRMVKAQKKPYVGLALSQRPGMTDASRPRLVGLKPVDSSQRIRAGGHLFAAGTALRSELSEGWMSSAIWSPHLESWIGLGFLAHGDDRRGEVIQAVYPLKNEQVDVQVCSPVFVDPDGERLRG